MKIKDRKFAVFFSLTMIFIILILFINMEQKIGFHIDEIYSYGLSNSNYAPFPWEFNTWLDGEYYQNYITATKGQLFDYQSVYYNQTQDVHPPLYYFILHSISSFLPTVFSKWIGLSLNLIIHLMVFFFTYLLLKNILNNKWVALFGGVFWILSKGAIDSLLFIRMYPLLTLIQIILLYFTIKYFEDQKLKKISVYIALIIFIGALTHYYFYVYAFLLTLVVCIIFLVRKQVKKSFIYGLSALSGIVGAILFFPAVFNHVSESNRGQEVLEGFESNLNSIETIYFKFIQEDVFRNLPSNLLIASTIAILLIVVIKLVKDKNKNYQNGNLLMNELSLFLVITLPVFIYVFIVQQVSHYETARYIFSVYPIIIVGLFYAAYYIFRIIIKDKEMINVVIGGLTVLVTVLGLATQDSEYKFVDNTYMNEYIDNIENQNILVVMDKYWKITNYVIDLKHFSKVYPVEINNMEENLPDALKLGERDNLYVLFNTDNETEVKSEAQIIKNKYNFEGMNIISSSSRSVIFEFK